MGLFVRMFVCVFACVCRVFVCVCLEKDIYRKKLIFLTSVVVKYHQAFLDLLKNLGANDRETNEKYLRFTKWIFV